MSARAYLAAAGLALAVIFLGAAPAAAQDAPPAAPPAPKKKAEELRGPAAEAARAAAGTEALAPDDEEVGISGDATASVPAPRAPSAPSASPPRPIGQTSRLGKVALPTKIDPKTGRPVVSISNADLERLYGNSVVPVSSSARSAEPPPTSALRDDGSALAPDDDAGGGGAAAKASRTAELDAELKRLNDNARSIANPFLPPPKLSDAEKAAMDGKDNKERLDLTRERIQELQQEKARLESSSSGEESSGR